MSSELNSISAITDSSTENIANNLLDSNLEKWEPGEELTLMDPPPEEKKNDKGSYGCSAEIPQDLLKTVKQYTSAFGTYCAWNQNVDLGPAMPGVVPPPEDADIKTYYDMLQHSLYEAKLPETKDRTARPRTARSSEGVAIAILSLPTQCIGILLEGGKQCPEDMLLILSTTWLSKRKSDRNNGQFSLYVHKAIVFKTGGRTYLDIFTPPRQVTYFVNNFTRCRTNGKRSDGDSLENSLDCPTGCTTELQQMIDNRLWTRIKMAECGVGYPETLAFAYRSFTSYEAKLHSITTVHLLMKNGVEDLIEEEINKFVNSFELEFTDKVVVKTAGVIVPSEVEVTYHSRTDVDAIKNAVLDLLKESEEENVIMIEAFYDTFSPPAEQEGAGYEWNAKSEHAIRLRATVCRAPDDTPIMTKLVAAIGDKDKPLNNNNTIPQGFHSTLRAYGITDEDERNRLYQVVREGSENLLKAIIDYEYTLLETERGGVDAQTDIIGVDYILYEKNGIINPVGIQLDTLNCTTSCQRFEFMNPESQGESVQPLIQTMICRSQKFIMRGKRILVVGAGGYSKRFIWDAAKEYDIEIILIDPDPADFASTKVSTFIEYDLTDHSKDDLHASNIVQMLKDRNITVHGCVTFWENCGSLAAAVCELLNFSTGSGLTASRIAARKTWTMDMLLSRTSEIPNWPQAYLYATKCYRVSSKKDIADAAIKMKFPAILKLECGSSITFLGVRHVQDAPSAYLEYDKIQEDLAHEKLERGIKVDNNIVLMEYITGTEHDVDIILYRRQMVGAFVSDIGLPRLPRYTKVAAALPSFLPNDKRAQLVAAAYQCCTGVGLANGIFNVRMKMSPTGPKLIEINHRMGEFYLRDWINATWGVDLLLYLFMISCDVKPVLPTLKLRGHIVGINCLPCVHRNALGSSKTRNLLDLLDVQGAIRINKIEEELGPPEDDKYEDVFCNVAVTDANPEQAQNRLIEYCALLELSHKDFEVPYYLKNFRY